MLQFKHWQPPCPKKSSWMRQKKTRMGGRCKSEGLWLVSSMIGFKCLSWINWSFWHFAWILNGCYFAQGCFIVFGFRMAGWLRVQRVGFKIHWWGCLGRNQFIRSKNLMNMNRLSENVSETPSFGKKVLQCLGECWFTSFQPFFPVILWFMSSEEVLLHC